MKRLWIASVSVLAALAARGYSQSTVPLDPTPISIVPGRAVVESVGQAAEKPKEGEKTQEKAALPATTAPIQASSNCDFSEGPTNGKPSLIDTHTGPPDQLWLRGSYLYWHLQDLPIPQVLATVDGQTLVGDQKVDYQWFSGGRIEGGMWFGCEHIHGIEFGGYILQRNSRDFSAAGNGLAGSSLITRPINDATTPGAIIPVIVASPQGRQGRIDISASTQMGSAEVSFARNLAYNGCFSFTTIAGFRYIDLMDDVKIGTDTRATDGTTPFVLTNPNAAIYDRLTINERFRTRNQLYAGQAGARIEFNRGIWFSNLRGSVALGPNQQSSEIVGETVASTPAGVQARASGGILAVPGVIGANAAGAPVFISGNAGQFRTDWFTVAPEFGLQIGAQLSRFVRVHVGYDFLYINNVVRPGDLIDTTVNRRFVPSSVNFGSASGPNRPAFRNNRDDFIAHGVEFGLQFSF